MKITIYELLGMIKDGEAPKKIKYFNKVYEYDYETMNYAHFLIDHYDWLLGEDITAMLNDEIEILEEEKKIPEKINNWISVVGRVDDSNIEEYVHKLFEQQTILYFKINSIIDYLKSKGE